MNTFLKFALPLVGALSVAGVANAVVVPGVYNTGLGVGGVALAAGDGQVDANYKVLSTNAGNVTVGGQALTYYNTAYLQDGPQSRIVNGTGDGSGVTGEVTTFRTTFNLTGFDSTNATLSGQVLFDNFGTISLNGNAFGGTFTGFNSLTPFGTSANFFLSGINTLDFTMNNVDGPAAFQVAGLTVTAARLPVVGGVPEPTSWMMMVAGFGLVGASVRRRKPTVVAA